MDAKEGRESFLFKCSEQISMKDSCETCYCGAYCLIDTISVFTVQACSNNIISTATWVGFKCLKLSFEPFTYPIGPKELQRKGLWRLQAAGSESPPPGDCFFYHWLCEHHCVHRCALYYGMNVTRSVMEKWTVRWKDFKYSFSSTACGVSSWGGRRGGSREEVKLSQRDPLHGMQRISALLVAPTALEVL